MYWPVENPGMNPYIVLIWCFYFIFEEIRQIKASHDITVLEDGDTSFRNIMKEYFDDPW